VSADISRTKTAHWKESASWKNSLYWTPYQCYDRMR